MGLPVRIGAPQGIGVSSPVYSSGVGIIKYAAGRKRYLQAETERAGKRVGLFKRQRTRHTQKEKMLDKLKYFLDEYF